ncbi:MAG: uL15 family ribosomal protein [DPANN group archaeon]|nr:uL15 family ribosomal protein [DPANN group archaeon]
MPIRRKKKSRKLRGSRTHGWGFGKRHRGKGSKAYTGGGGGKRGAHHETFFLSKGIEPIGKHGMSVRSRIVKIPVITINIREIEERFHEFEQEKLAEKKADAYSVDLTKLGFVKVLSEGKPSRKLNVICSSCSTKAKQKIEKAGGSVAIKE